MSRLVNIVAAATLVACGTGGGRTSAPVETTSREVVNLRAFARLYGVVRWFHPSDEAAATDWNAFAIRGVQSVRDVPDQKALANALTTLVKPFSAGIVIGPAADIATLSPPAAPTGVTEWVAWQYKGPGFDGGQEGVYEAKRTGRKGHVSSGGDWGAFSQAVDAVPHRGKPIRLRAQLRAGTGSRVGAWVRVDLASGGNGFFDNMMDRAVTSSTWQEGAIDGTVDADAKTIVVGGLVMGSSGGFDAFALEVKDSDGVWKRVALANPEFDDGTNGWNVGIEKAAGARFALTAEARTGGGKAASLASGGTELVADLFDERPAQGEDVIVDLGDGLAARVPVSLPSLHGHTVPAVPSNAAAAGALMAMSNREGALAIADNIVAWNVFAHFYPYLDVISTDWHAYLDEALVAAVAGNADALERLVVAAEDGHGHVTSSASRRPLPMLLDIVEDKVVVIASNDASVKPGDEIVSIDGVAAAAARAAEYARHSGSPQWRTHRTMRALGNGPEGSAASIDVRRGAATTSVVVKRGDAPDERTYPAIGEVEPGIWLVDLARVETTEIDAQMAKLATAKGIVFDMRGYPNGTHGVLAHLMDAPENDRWMHIAHITRPNLPVPASPSQWTSVGWDMAPIAPRFTGKVVFMTGPGAISYAESVMGYVEALGLPIVGAATAGTNGNIRMVGLPSGAGFVFTGMKVTRHDGTRSHLEGIRPTVPASRTIAGVAAGKDEVLERALSLVR